MLYCPQIRCSLCAGLRHRTFSDEILLCNLCGLGFRRETSEYLALKSFCAGSDRFEFPNWNTLQTKLARRPPQVASGFLFSMATVRSLAAREGRRVAALQSRLPFGNAFAPWNYGDRIRAEIKAWPIAAVPKPDPRLTLGIIAANSARQDVLDLCADTAGVAAEVIVVLDTADAADAAGLERDLADALQGRGAGRPRVIAHPLASNFACQRNRIQEAATTAWVLQLDCDERLESAAKSRMTGILDDAEQRKLHAVALPRRNLVDGQVSALYPDVQYRLLRHTVRFTRAVHEYPLLGKAQPSTVHFGPGLIHNLASERLDRRAKTYEGILEGASRPQDTALLRQPLEAGVQLPV